MNQNPLPITLFDSYSKSNFTLGPGFEPTVAVDTLKIYSCGPTVYSVQHIGNMRAAWFADTLNKVARLAGWSVDWVQNVTDVGHLVSDGDDGEDKIEKGARKEGKSTSEIVHHYLTDYLAQTQMLGLNLPTGLNLPKATEYINEQMILALELVKNGKAYILQDGIYFDSNANQQVLDSISNLPGMPKTEGDNQYTGREIENTTKNPADFALWKFVIENSLQKWKFEDFSTPKSLAQEIIKDSKDDYSWILSAWGCPGWHSECVTMISEIIGKKRFTKDSFSFDSSAMNSYEIDVHTGGIEHIPVHHKNEILQSESLGFHLSKHWVHFEHLLVNDGKMSKSLGNTYTVHDIAKRGFDPLAFKVMLFEHNYQDKMNFTWEKLEQSQNRLHNLRKEGAKLTSLLNRENVIENLPGAEAESEYHMDLVKILVDNLNTSEFLSAYQNELTNLVKAIQSNGLSAELSSKAQYLFRFETELLNLNIFPFFSHSQQYSLVFQKASSRQQAKLNKDWPKADQIRDDVANLGWQIDDYAWGFGIWKK